MGQKFTCEEVIEALRETKGMVYLAARRLGCVHQTVYNYIKRYPTVKTAWDAESGVMGDTTELKLYQAIMKDESWAIAFYLRTKGKDRGYSERTEITGAGGAQLRIELHWPEDDGDNPASAA